MEPKGALKRSRAGLATVEAQEAKAEAASLSQAEENVVRMLHGRSPGKQALLPKACGGNEEVADELLLVEMQLFRAARMRRQAGAVRRSPRKSKIISALREKK